MIKISFRKNLIYLLLLIIFYLLRRTLSIVIDKMFGLDNSVIFCLLMFLGEIVGGAWTFFYQRTFLKKKKAKINNMLLRFIKNKNKLNRADGWPKIMFLIFSATSFDLVEFIILSNFIPKIAALSTTSTLRLCCVITITSTALCVTMLRFKIGRHQIVSLIVFGTCSIIIVILEFIYKPKDVDLASFIISYVLVICHFIFLSFTDVTERYLADYDYLNPLQILMIEGIFGFIMTSFYGIYQDPFKEVRNIHKEIDTGNFIILIFLLFLYFVFSAGINVYKILCNVLYSPMTKSLTTYFFNSIFIIYFFIDSSDFITNGERNYFYFFINLFFSLLLDFFGLIYNELFVLTFCGLSKDTHEGISHRAANAEMELITRQGTNPEYSGNLESDD